MLRSGGRVRTAAAATWALGAVCAASGAAGAQVLLTQDEALKLAFPPAATVERRTAFLGEDDLKAARAEAGSGVEVDGSVVTYYLASLEGKPIGAAYFDVHRVRTLPVVLMIVVTPQERIERIEILKWSEPPEYRAPPGWLRQVQGHGLTDDLSLRGAIRNMTGATLTSQAITRAARRVLAMNRIIRPFAASASPGPGDAAARSVAADTLAR